VSIVAEAMTDGFGFGEDDWRLVVVAPTVAGLIVAAAQRGGLIREAVSISEASRDAAQAATSRLVREVARAAPTAQRPRFRSAADLRVRGLGWLEAACRVVERTVPATEAYEYARFVLEVAERAAAAHRENERSVSDAEAATLAAIRRALGLGEPRAPERG
jgi:hypothetical protein